MAKAKSTRNSRKVVTDVKLAQTNDAQPEVFTVPLAAETPAPAAPKVKAAKKAKAPKVVTAPMKSDSLVRKGAIWAVLAGRPSKQAVIACFGKSGYALSWIQRAERLNMTPGDLTQAFVDDPAATKRLWKSLPKPERKSAAKS